MGCEVTVISTSEKKKDEALKVLGADHFLISKNEDDMKVCAAVPSITHLPPHLLVPLQPASACLVPCHPPQPLPPLE